MDTSPLPGFITRKQAAELCQRAERTLQRYWSRAITHRDNVVLQHLVLRAEDGRTIEGADVTKELIEELKHSSQNPTWYVHADWAAETYGPRSRDANNRPVPPKTVLSSPSDKVETTAARDVKALLEEQLQKKEEEVAYLRDELKIKNEQIREANERTRESNVLMRDLQKMLGDWQQQAFRSLPAGDPATNPADDSAQPEETINVDEKSSAQSEQGSRPPRETATGRKSSSSSSKKQTRPRAKKQSIAKQSPTLLAKHAPTFHKAFSNLFRRS